MAMFQAGLAPDADAVLAVADQARHLFAARG
jgi:hypothetical protein